jgi:UDP-glucose 4-epimerase
MRVLITGGAGFIGSHLAERWLMEGWEVAVLDDLSTGSLANIDHLKHRSDFKFAFGSVMEGSLLNELMDSCDVVYHLAAAVGVRLIVENPVQTITTNVHGTEAVLSAAVRARIPVFIASTSEVYGKSTAIPFREDADLVLGPTTKARWSYAASKALDEFLGIAYWRHRGVPATIVRFFNTVGPRQSGRYGMVLPTFVRQAMRGDAITIFGDGEQRRCFGFVADVVEALIRLARAPGISGEVINIGNDREITVNELALLVKRTVNSSSPIIHIPYDSAYGPGFEDMFRRVPCLQKLHRLTGYRPETPIEEVVTTVVEHERSKYAAPQYFRAAAALVA